ncbi:MAG: hypothetical protein ACP5NP_01565 [Acetobacteraceae bacterium]
MRLRFRRARLLAPLLAPLVMPMALAGCGPGRNQFPPSCPAIRPLPEAASLRRFRPGSHDVTGLMLQGRIVAANGKCRRVDDGAAVAARLTLTMRLTRGPATPPGGVPVPYFLAVSRGGRILTKATFSSPVKFPPGQDTVTATTSPFDLRFPVRREGGAAAYTIWVGFQLTPGEFAAEGGR